MDGLIDYGLDTDVIVRQSYQPTQVGTESKSSIYFFKIGDHRYGSLGIFDEWDLNLLQMTHTEIQHYESTFQINALSIQDPSNITSLTASDLVNITSAILQSYKAQQSFSDNDIGVLRITDIRNTHFLNDMDNFEASPSFDFILSHKQIKKTVSPIVESKEIKIYRV